MNAGRYANKPKRRWSRPYCLSEITLDQTGAVASNDHTSANALKSHHSYLALAREATSKGDTIGLKFRSTRRAFPASVEGAYLVKRIGCR